VGGVRQDGEKEIEEGAMNCDHGKTTMHARVLAEINSKHAVYPFEQHQSSLSLSLQQKCITFSKSG